MEEITKHYLISGRVQGVGFRAFTKTHALTLGIRGWVRNLQDGRVEIVAQGRLESMQLFEVYLKAGPRHGEVATLMITNRNLSHEAYNDFEIRKDGLASC